VANVAHVAPVVNGGRNIVWHRSVATSLFEEYRELRGQGVSERAAAKRLKVPRTTLQAWTSNAATIDADPAVIAFFESQPGLAFLHRLAVALHVVFVEWCACGIRPVCRFLELTRLDRFIASSYTSQQRVNVAVQNQIINHADGETARLARTMPEKDISVAMDETFTGGPTLVAMDIESDFLLLEEPSKSRDRDAWKAAMDKPLADLKVNIIQATTDQAKALVAYTENILGAQQSPDLFHVQQEGSRAVSGPMAAKVRAAEQAVEKAKDDFGKARIAAVEYLISTDSRGPGRPPDWDTRTNRLAAGIQQATDEAERIQAVREGMRADVKGISETYHFVDLETGERRSGSIVAAELQKKVDSLRTAAIGEGLGESSMDRIAKAERVLPQMAKTIEFVSGYVNKQVEKLGLTPRQAYLFHAKLIPAAYLQRIAARRNKEEGTPLMEKAADLASPVFAADGPFGAIDAVVQERLRVEANRLAGIFQRSSSCVEGRNGVLSFRHHGLRGIPLRKRRCLTALHNFFIKRADDTTAAERFFESKPRDLFHAVLAAVDVPRRPRSSARKLAGCVATVN
jgi:hypothetical protein